MTWYEVHGYSKNPFDVGSAEKGEETPLGRASTELVYQIQAGNMVLVEGPKGSGKSWLLNAAIGRFAGEKRVIYFDCQKDDIDIKKLMQNRYGIFGRILNMTPKGMILLLDNVISLDKKNLELAKYYYDNDYLQSLVIVGESKHLSGAIRDRIGSRIIHLRKPTVLDALDSVKARLGSYKFLPEHLVKKIFQLSNKDMAKFLENCSKVCNEATNLKVKLVDESHLQVIGDKN